MRKFVLMLVTVITVVMLAYLVVPIGLPKDIMQQYNDLNSGSAIYNHSKESFYTEYIDNYRNESTSINDDIYSEGDPSVVIPPPGEEGTGTMPEPSPTPQPAPVPNFDWLTQINNLVATKPYYKDYFAIRDCGSAGKLITELQKGGIWSVYKPSQSTMSSAGCFYYAVGCYLSNTTGQLWTIEDILTKLGGTVTYQSGAMKVSGNPISNLSGSCNQLNKVLSACGVNKTARDTGMHSITDEALNGGKWLFVYATTGSKGILSSGGTHWLLCTGYDANNYYFIPNGSRGVAVPKSQVKNIYFKYIYEIN